MGAFGATSRTEPGPNIQINCPHCFAKDVQAKTGIVSETTYILIIPVWWSQVTLVRCLSCKTDFETKLHPNDLLSRTPEELEALLKLRSNFIGAFFAFFSWFVCMVPGLGTFFAILAIVVNRKSRKWIRVVSWVGLLLSIVVGLSSFRFLERANSIYIPPVQVHKKQ